MIRSARSTKFIRLALATDGVAYADGDQVGVLMKLSGALDREKGSARIKSVSVIDLDAQSQPIDVLFFSEKPTNTGSNNNPPNITDSELVAKFLGTVKIAAADYTAFVGGSIASKQSDLPVVGTALTTASTVEGIWVLAVIRGAGTFPTATGLNLLIGVEHD